MTHRFRVRFALEGAHISCRVFIGLDGNWAIIGTLKVSRGPEFRDLVMLMGDAEFIGDNTGFGIAAACEVQ